MGGVFFLWKPQTPAHGSAIQEALHPLEYEEVVTLVLCQAESQLTGRQRATPTFCLEQHHQTAPPIGPAQTATSFLFGPGDRYSPDRLGEISCSPGATTSRAAAMADKPEALLNRPLRPLLPAEHKLPVLGPTKPSRLVKPSHTAAACDGCRKQKTKVNMRRDPAALSLGCRWGLM